MGDILDGKRPGVKVSQAFEQKPSEVELLTYVYQLHKIASKPQNKGAFLSIIGNHELFPYFLRQNPQYIRDYTKKVDIDEWGGINERTIEFFTRKKIR